MLEARSKKEGEGFEVKFYHILIRKPSEAPHEMKNS